jgi:hypothetical protein
LVLVCFGLLGWGFLMDVRCDLVMWAKQKAPEGAFCFIRL